MGNRVSPRAGFLFATCQVGAEGALKSEMARRWPGFHFAFSRPGFLTFKLPTAGELPIDFHPRLTFARAHGFSLGMVAGESLPEQARQFWAHLAELAGRESPGPALHVWQRDPVAVGYRGFEPAISDEARQAEAEIARQRPAELAVAPHCLAQPGQTVLDCVLVEPGKWCVGFHVATDGPSCLPGGIEELALPAEAVSRAYLKMEEALRWSGLKPRPGELCVELGCSPGGSSQALLARGLRVIGIDPAPVDARLAASPNFTHLQKRGAEVRRRLLRNVRWLTADVNVAPGFTLDMVEDIVTRDDINVRGMLLTLKLLNWELADELPAYVERVESWGYGHVRARQLAHNRQELCLAAMRRRPRMERG